MPIESFSQLSVGISAVATLGFVVKEFLKRMKERDEFLKQLIDNHFKHHNQALEDLIAVIKKLERRIELLSEK